MVPEQERADSVSRLCGPWWPASLAILAVIPASTAAQRPPVVELQAGMVITSSVRVMPRIYEFGAPQSLDSAVIVVRGSDITVDFAGATLQGLAVNADPDQATGVAIRVDSGANVRIRNARVRGYKIGLLARGTRGLFLEENDFSYNWKPRLFSLIEHESLVDWLSHHRNDNGEWLRFGAGVYLTDVRGGEIRGNRIEQGMEGLMLVRTDSLRIWNNTIEFNSGVGIGLYRSSHNQILHNHASYNVRGYSHGFYRRGQDSADLLLYEQSSHNIVAFNSMTHGGDGLFLWAGQSTMDTGQGGANDNLFYANDFSFAPTNAMEATFSRNTFIGNRAEGSEYGLWAGYSFESRVWGNDFSGNRTGIAIEHGQNNEIVGNRFVSDSVAINLWANAIEPSDWGYPRRRDTRSRDYRISENVFSGHRVALRVADTRNASFQGNRLISVDSMVVVRDSTRVVMAGNDTAARHQPRNRAAVPAMPVGVSFPSVTLPAPLAGGLDRNRGGLALRDRSAIMVDEWGPYDWRSPKLWPLGSDRALSVTLRVLGPPGRWRVVGRRGVAQLSRTSGVMNDTLAVIPTPGGEGDWEVTLEYRGAATISPRGERFTANQPQRFSYRWFEPRISWKVDFFTWTDAADPRTQPEAFAALLRAQPVLARAESRLDYLWYRPSIADLPQARVAALATSYILLGPGEYTLRTISDDGVRVWVDNRLVIDNWKPHDSAVDHAPISGGRHSLRVEYYQVDGWTELRLEILRGVLRSTGSPGPH
ncbi:MAG: NosD domain-containing protein [Longimicrobiales bacterium]